MRQPSNRANCENLPQRLHKHQVRNQDAYEEGPRRLPSWHLTQIFCKYHRCRCIQGPRLIFESLVAIACGTRLRIWGVVLHGCEILGEILQGCCIEEDVGYRVRLA